MGKPAKDIESINRMISVLDRVQNTLETIKKNGTSVKEACEKNGISYAAFRRVVFNTDWEANNEDKHVYFKKRFSEYIPLYHWTEILFCDVMCLNRTPDSIAKMPSDVRETVERAVSSITEREQKVIRMIYEDNMAQEEIGEELGLTGERVRQIRAKAMRKLQHPSRMAIFAFGDGFYANKRKFYDDVYSNAVIEAQVKEANKLELRIKELQKFVDRPGFKKPEKLSGNPEIAVLDLSVRSFNCLYRSGIHTVSDLCNLTDEELRSIRNLGFKSYNEIRDTMERYGLKLRES